MKTYLVTGGAGFIGSNLVDALLKQGHRVRVLDDFSTGFHANLSKKKIILFTGSVCSLSLVKKAVKGVDGVFHLAASRAVVRSVENPIETNDINVGGLLNVLMASRDAKVKRVVFASSSAIYGETKAPVLGEEMKPMPESPYAATKVMGEYYCRMFYRLYGLETVSLRYFNVFGPRQNPESKYSAVIPMFVQALSKNKSPEIHWDGKQSRDFLHVDSVAQANLRAMQAPKKVCGDVFNIGHHEEHSILELYRALQKIMGKEDIRPIFKPKRKGDVRRSCADIRKAKKMLKYRPKTEFVQGLEETVCWFLNSTAPDKYAARKRRKN